VDKEMNQLSDEQLEMVDGVIEETETYNFRLSSWEYEFIIDLSEKREKYGENLMLSDKQLEVVERIRLKLIGE
jgi:hypothetical protein